MRGGRRRERAGHGPRRRARQCGGAGSGPRLDVRDAEPAPSHPPRSDPLRGSRVRGRPSATWWARRGPDRIRERCAEHRRRASARGRSFSSPGTGLRCAASLTEPPPKIRRPPPRAPEVPFQGVRVLDDRAKPFETDGTATQLDRLGEGLALDVDREQSEGRRERILSLGPGSPGVRTTFRSPTPAAAGPASGRSGEIVRSGSDNPINGHRNGFLPTQACVGRLRNPQINL